MSLDELKPFILWIQAHPHWSGLAVFAIVLIESLAIIGLFFPGIMIMIALGILIGSGMLPAISTLTWIVLGALAGDLISYWLGYHYRDYILEMWPFRLFPTLIIKGEKFFESHGGKSIFLGRFLGPIRPTLPMIAGMLNMPPLRFTIIDAISTIIWALIYMAPGILIGVASQALAPEMATRLIGFLIMTMLVLGVLSWTIQRFLAWCKIHFNIWIQSLWRTIQQQPKLAPIYRLLKNPQQPQDHHQLTLSLLFILGSLAFLFLVINVYLQGVLTQLNLPLFHLMRSLYQVDLEKIMVAITFIGEAPVMLVFFSGVLAFLIWSRYWYTAAHWLTVGLLAVSTRGILKKLLAIPRPSGLIQSPSGWSFPSGHCTLTMAFLGFFAVMIANYLSPQNRRWCYTITASVIGLVALSRLYLGAHWLTDAFGGILLGWLIVLIVTISYRRLATLNLKTLNLFAAGMISLVIGYTGIFIHSYTKAVHNYTPYWPTHSLDANLWWRNAKSKIPLTYIENRFGKIVQTANIEWAASLADIKQTLQAAGWKIETTSLVTSTVNYISTKDKNVSLPPTLLLHHGQKPALIMSKALTGSNQLLVLRLWDSHLKMYNTKVPLWIGSIHLRKHKKHKMNLTVTSAIESLITPLNATSFEWKTISAPAPALNHKEDRDWDSRILLIKQK